MCLYEVKENPIKKYLYILKIMSKSRSRRRSRRRSKSRRRARTRSQSRRPVAKYKVGDSLYYNGRGYMDEKVKVDEIDQDSMFLKFRDKDNLLQVPLNSSKISKSKKFSQRRRTPRSRSKSRSRGIASRSKSRSRGTPSRSKSRSRRTPRSRSTSQSRRTPLGSGGTLSEIFQNIVKSAGGSRRKRIRAKKAATRIIRNSPSLSSSIASAASPGDAKKIAEATLIPGNSDAAIEKGVKDAGAQDFQETQDLTDKASDFIKDEVRAENAVLKRKIALLENRLRDLERGMSQRQIPRPQMMSMKSTLTNGKKGVEKLKDIFGMNKQIASPNSPLTDFFMQALSANPQLMAWAKSKGEGNLTGDDAMTLLAASGVNFTRTSNGIQLSNAGYKMIYKRSPRRRVRFGQNSVTIISPRRSPNAINEKRVLPPPVSRVSPPKVSPKRVSPKKASPKKASPKKASKSPRRRSLKPARVYGKIACAGGGFCPTSYRQCPEGTVNAGNCVKERGYCNTKYKKRRGGYNLGLCKDLNIKERKDRGKYRRRYSRRK